MHFVFTPLAALSGLAALISAAICIMAWNRRRFAGVGGLALLMASVAFWSAGAMCELSVTSIAAKVWWSKIEYIGTLSTPVLFFLLALDYNHIYLLRSRRWLCVLFAVPLLCLLLACTNEWHQLIWTSYRYSPSGYNLLIYGHGPVFWLGVAGYSYLMMLLGSLLMIRAMHYYPAHFRGQSIILLLSATAPWFGNVLYLTGTFPLHGLDPTPHSFAITGIVFAIDLLYLRQLYLVPVARARAFEAMGDGIVVVDHQLRILDLNPAGAHMLGRPLDALQGGTLPAPWLDIRMLDEDGRHLELMSPEGGKILDIRAYAVDQGNSAAHTRMLVMRDITLRREAEDALKNANQQLIERLAEIEQLQTALREQALRDPLTGLFNRRYLDETFEREKNRAERERHPIAVAMIDLDNFKRINDQHGHQMGDQVLRSLAGLLQRESRAADIVCRLGGEEFLVLLPGSDAEQARQRVEHWRCLFAAMLHVSQRQSFHTSFSCGIAALPDHGADLHQLYQRADQALYQAKAAGKNRSCLAGESAN
ncbi:histidine kinase N-terminal 7TM domain-containing protein [Chromobacterium sp. IIBBL 290-4]|uniref:histidine kinase N-terminal 7TM domain-containing diguanylate cyclase n=1 Tax=Chromobacterium sp. IIBBL 290-4 TaxID=2953890 RepID=UPI0020B63EAE|nr:histidine kinase N-terminal 7TM domain-containing protein [Chromobacterium sp. IIBBL 290-4]UTH75097.1 diguanylate cyclase [Chromobacterium sp. IIBBL 290-4]